MRFFVCVMILFLAGMATGYGKDAAQAGPLVSDPDHDVIVVEEAPLDVRFGKVSSFPSPVRACSNGTVSAFISASPVAAFAISEDWSSINAAGAAQRVVFECYDAGKVERMDASMFPEGIKRGFSIEEAAVSKGDACAALGLDAGSCGKVTQARLFRVNARDMKYPDGRMEEVRIRDRIYMLTTEKFFYVFVFEAGDAREPSRISFETRIDAPVRSTPSIRFEAVSAGASPPW